MKRIMIMMMLFAPMVAMAQKFGHIDSSALISSLPEMTTIQVELQAAAQAKEKELQTMQDELKREADEYEKKKATLTAGAQKEAETALQEKYQKLQELYTKSQEEMQKQQEEKAGPLYQKIPTAIWNVGKAGQYTYIFEKGAALYVGDNSKDVTEEVKAELQKMK